MGRLGGSFVFIFDLFLMKVARGHARSNRGGGGGGGGKSPASGL